MMTNKLEIALIILSAAWVHFVSAGGAYCAKTARARAAALGLGYPGVHGAPDLSGPPPFFAQHPSAPHHQHSPNNPQPPAMDYNEFYNLPREFPHFQPAGYGSHSLAQSNLLSKLSGGEPVTSHPTNFEQVKHDGPLTQMQPPGMDKLMYRALESQKYPLPLVYNWPGMAVDAYVPNTHGTRGVKGPPLPLSPAYGVYYVVYPVGAGAKQSVMYPMATRGSVPDHAAWQMYGRSNMKPRNPFYPSHLDKSEELD
ncbi:uncharacterized protein LOC129411863 [Boleophthalmus pectinirostris]|uniref:uncharacterized protein LOC129411863 n=1 Tax=Boleophthalmus pectinirostris TaxID=150288 RepID=UPI00242C7978|nr:uncharacterized protein LOC129411863 [Boleophthalmus pectinirostris]